MQQMQQIRIKRERSPNHTMIGQGNMQAITVSPNHHRQSPLQLSSSPQSMHPSLQLRHPMRDAAILLRVKNESHPGLIQTQHRMIWGPQARINGVKPEVIGGPLPPLRNQMSPQQQSPQTPTPPQTSQTPPRSTPTVIMGESCGVRTMVWSFEPAPQAQTPSTTPTHTPGPSQNNHEEAAHLLLSLGQGMRQGEIRPRAPSVRSPHPLNMERLWAGDYSQLPAGQQMHALNLSSQQQWAGLQGTNKVGLS
jgi:nuclear receptor subfamily 6 group A